MIHILAMSLFSTPVMVVLLFALASSCCAATQAVIPDGLQREAMSCVGEAMQICPDVWMAEDHGLACMTGKRASFTPRCRVIYDKVAHAINGKR